MNEVREGEVVEKERVEVKGLGLGERGMVKEVAKRGRKVKRGEGEERKGGGKGTEVG